MKCVSQVLTVPGQLTPNMLTAILLQQGVLEQGAVESIAIDSNPAFKSAICHLRVSYGPGSSPDAPRALVLKRNLPEGWAREAGRTEVEFYTDARSRGDGLPMIVPCYDAAYDAASGDSHLLLLDLSATHESLVTRDNLLALRGVPSQAHLEAAVDALARFHASWWEHPSLTDGRRDVSGWYGTRERFAENLAQRRREWAVFIAGVGAELPADLVSLYRHVLENLSKLWDRGLGDRITSGRQMTLVHGDCYLSQFLSPRDRDGGTFLVDWQGASADLPTIDLTHLFATFWTREQRQEGARERRLLERYLACLEVEGVTGYDWEALQDDYRLLLIYMVLYPVWDAVNGSSKSYWWPKMRCLTSAYRDWRCEELLRQGDR